MSESVLTSTEEGLLDEEFGDDFTVQWRDAINRILSERWKREAGK